VIHNLTMGHFDPEAIADRQAVPLRTLDSQLVRRLLDEVGERDNEGRDTLGGLPVEYQNGCVVARWLVGSLRNRKAEEFAVKLHRRTGCLIADREHGRLIDHEALVGGEGADRVA
jgi:hypothetical protein